MANEREIKIVLKADGTAAIAGIRSVGTELDGFGSKAASFAQSFQKNWAAIGAGVTAAYLALQKIWGAMDAAATYQDKMEMLSVLTARYGTTAEDLTRAITRNSQGLIDMATAANVATDALGKGFTPEQVEQMAKWAPTLADISGQAGNTSDAFRSLEESLVAARERGVVQFMGATIDLEAQIGKQYATMSKAERSAALYNLVAQRMATIQKEVGTEQNAAADRMERFNNSLLQAKIFLGQLLLVVGQPFMAVFNMALGMAYGLAAGIGNVVGALAMLTDKLGVTKGSAEKVFKWADGMAEHSANQMEQMLSNVKGGLDQLLSLGTVGGGAGATFGKGFNFGGDGRNVKRLEEEQKERQKLIEEEAKAWGAVAEVRIREDEEVAKAISESLKDQVRKEDEARTYSQTKAAEYYQWEIDERNRVITEGYDKWLEAETRLLEIRREQKDLLFASNMANTQEALNAIGGSELSANLGMVGAIGAGTDPYTQDFERWKALQDEKLAYLAQIGATEQEWQAAFVDEQLQRESMLNQKKIALAANTFGVIGNLGAAMYAASGNKSKEAFAVMKAYRIGETMMNTYSAAVGAYNALCNIPYVGPALGAAAAAAAIAYGMAQVKAISAMRPGGSSASSASASVISAGSASASSSNYPAVEEPETKTGPVVNVHVYGNIVDHDAFARELIPSITKAISDGVV